MAKWDSYLKNAGKRLGKEEPGDQPGRSSYQRDYDRIIFSDAFRRLQNKTQVLPIPESDVVRNRLTHSLETASVARSLGYLAGQNILERHSSLRLYGFRADDFGYIVSAAALAHDIGNPPFGHQGEEAISRFFLSDKAVPFLENLTGKQKAELQQFEGNAAGFRILARTTDNRSASKGGLRLSLATYAAFIKYPREVFVKKEKHSHIAMKKFGIFQSEKSVFETLAAETGLIPIETSGGLAFNRHPLAYLTEAADDICYNIIDYEDGFTLGIIPFERIEYLFKSLIRWTGEQRKTYQSIYEPKQKIGFLRALVINRLVQESVRVFLDHEDEILSGKFPVSLQDKWPEDIRQVLMEIRKESVEKIYHHPTVLKIEATGKTVIPFLLEKFLHAAFDPKSHKQYYLLMPEAYRQADDAYERVMQTVMFISGMTDREAVYLYRNFNGIELAGY